jgi:RHS repeat-associated protein
MRNTLAAKPIDRAIAVLWIVLISTLGCPPQGKKLAPAAGLPQFQERAAVEVPGAIVNPLGGNLLVRRSVLSIDTHLGTRAIGAAYNSASGEWLWSFDISYDGASFVDPTGAAHDTSSFEPGDAIPGTVWVVVDSHTVKTKGGLAFEFDVDSRLGAIHYTSAEYPRLIHTREIVAGEPRAVAIDQCMSPGNCELVFTISYGLDGQVASIADRAGRVAEIEYAGDRLVSVRDGLDTVRGWPGTRYEYSGAELSAIVSSEGERVEFGYAGRRVQEVRAIGEENPLHRFDYYVKNKAGLFATRYIDPLGQVNWFRYDRERRLHEREWTDAAETLYLSWEGLRVGAETLPSGVTTSWSYQNDDVATEIQPSGNVVHFSHAADAVNRDALLERAPLEIVDSVGLRERRSYDANGRLATVENGEGELVASYVYAADQTIASLTTVDGEIVYGNYGPHGHPGLAIVFAVEFQREYDQVGNLLWGSDGVLPEAGGIVSREYDEDRNLRRITVADAGYRGIPAQPNQTIEIEHRSDGQRTRIARPGGGDHEFDYDSLGRLVQVRERVDGAWAPTTYEYDAMGRTTATERANGMRREADYDAVGRLVSIRNLRDGVIESSATLGYVDGQLRSVEDSLHAGFERYWYDAAGRIEAIEYPDGEMLFQQFDLRSRATHQTFATDSLLRWLSRGYDLADREVSLSDTGEPLLEHLYQDGKLVETSYGNGLVRSYSYDPWTGQLTGSRTEGTGGVVEETVITREGSTTLTPALDITAVTTTSGGVVATTNEEYLLGPEFGPLDHAPVAGQRVYMWQDPAQWSSYEYDALSNRLGSVAHGESFQYNAERNRLLAATTAEAGSIEYGYDEAGFATSRAGVPLTWTASGRLASYGNEVLFEWDALDRKLRSELMGVESRWLFGGLVQADAAGVPHSVDLDEVRVDLAAGQHRYRHLDFRGNVKFVSDQDGEVRSHYQYDAYGLRRVIGADDDLVRFVGRVQIGELMVLGARIYDPAVGRFLSPDPVLQHVNQYAYTLGNPVWFVDPIGRNAEVVLGFIVASFGMALATMSLFLAVGVLATLVASASFGVAGLGFGLSSAFLLDSIESGGSSGVVGGPGQGSSDEPGGGLGGSGPASCSPVELASVPGLGYLHWIVIAAQLLLAPLVIRSWGRRRRRR